MSLDTKNLEQALELNFMGLSRSTSSMELLKVIMYRMTDVMGHLIKSMDHLARVMEISARSGIENTKVMSVTYGQAMILWKMSKGAKAEEVGNKFLGILNDLQTPTMGKSKNFFSEGLSKLFPDRGNTPAWLGYGVGQADFPKRGKMFGGQAPSNQDILMNTLRNLFKINIPPKPTVGPALAAGGNIMGGMMGGFMSIFPQMAAMMLVFRPLAALIEGLLDPFEPLIDMFGSMGEILGTAFVPLVGDLMRLMQPFLPILAGVATLLGPLIKLFFEILTPIGQLLMFFDYLTLTLKNLGIDLTLLPTQIGQWLTDAGVILMNFFTITIPGWWDDMITAIKNGWDEFWADFAEAGPGGWRTRGRR